MDTQITVLSVYQRRCDKGSSKWHVDWIEHGRRRSRTLPTHSEALSLSQSLRSALPASPESMPQLLLPLPAPPAASAAAPLFSTIDSLAMQYGKVLKAREDCDQHVSNTRRYILWIIQQERIETADQITRTKVELALGRLREMGRSLATVNRHLSAIKGFVGWLEEEGLLAPLQASLIRKLRKFNEELDPRKEYVAISQEQFLQLFETVQRLKTAGEGYNGIDWNDRLALYIGALGTGLRERALRALRVGDFSLATSPAFAKCDAMHAKSKKRHVAEVPPWVAAYLAEYFRGALADRPAFRLPSDPTKMLRKDLRDAGISPFTLAADGRKRDMIVFYSFRHAHAQWLKEGGLFDSDLQKQMGHSSLEVTMRHYVVLPKGNVSSRFPDMPIFPSDGKAAG